MVTAYGDDFARWAQEQADAVREGRFAELDLVHLGEEIEGLSKSDRNAMRSRLIILLAHLLKLKYQPENATRSWRNTVKEQARQIELLTEDSPSLRSEAITYFARAYDKAREKASDETGLAPAAFPATPTPDIENALRAALAGEDFGFS
jgi:hypothetical protein